MNIKLHVERLVLDGVPVARTLRGRVRAAVEHELIRLLASGGLAHELRSGGAIAVSRGGNIQITKPNDPGTLGKQVAKALYDRIGNKK